MGMLSQGPPAAGSRYTRKLSEARDLSRTAQACAGAHVPLFSSKLNGLPSTRARTSPVPAADHPYSPGWERASSVEREPGMDHRSMSCVPAISELLR